MKWIFILPVFFLSSVLLHELGHAVTALLLGVEDISVRLWPGVTIFSTFPDYYYVSHIEWPRTKIASTDLYRIPVDFSKAHHGLSMFMGSGLNQLISLLCLIWYIAYRPAGKRQVLCIAGMLLVYDGVTYIIFPTVFNVRHLVFAGGVEPEPLLALEYLGLGSDVAVSFICLLIFQVVLIGWLLCSGFKSTKK